MGKDLSNQINLTKELENAKKKIAELEKDNKKYSDIFETIGDGLIIVNKKGIVLEVNSSLGKITGIPKEKLIGKSAVVLAKEFLSVKLIPQILKIIASVLKGGSIERYYLNYKNIIFEISTFHRKNDDIIIAILTDVTEKKRIEKQYQKLLDNAPVGMLIIQQSKIVYTNETLAKTLAYKNTQELIGLSIIDFIHPDYIALAKKRLAKLMEKENAIVETLEEKMIRKDGTIIHTLIVGHSINYQGSLAIQGYIFDISKEKKIEKELKDSLKRFEMLSNLTFEGILIHNRGKVIECNQSLSNMTGYDYNELISQDIIELVVPKKYHKIIQENIIKPYAKPYEIEFVRKDGKQIPVEIESQNLNYKGENIRVTAIRDIRDRKKAEKELKESEEKFHTLIENMSDALYVSDLNGNIIECNLVACKNLDYSREELLSKNISELSQNFIEEKHIENIWPKINIGKSIVLITAHIRKDGTIFPVELHITKLELNGKIAILGLARDITHRILAEKELKESEEKFSNLFNNAPDSIFLMEYDKFIECNNKTLEMYSCEYQQIIGHTPYEFSPDKQPDGSNSKEKSLEYIDAARAGTPQLFEWVHIKYDGTPFDAEIHLNKIEINSKIFIQAIVRDIREQHKAEKELKESEEKYRNIFQNSPIGLYKISLDNNKLIDCNHQAAIIFGYSNRRKFIENYNFNAIYFDNEVRDKFRKEIKEQGKVYIEAKFKKKDNTFFWGRESALYDKKSNVIEGVIEDITDRKNAELQIIKLNKSLDQKVKDRTAELNDALDELKAENERTNKIFKDLKRYKDELAEALKKEKELSKLKSAFTTMVSHQYRTPLTVITTSAELIARYNIENNPDKIDFYVNRIILSVDRMVDMLEKILLLGKYEIDNDYYLRTKENININEIVIHKIEETKIYDQNKHKFKFTYDSSDCILTTEYFYLEQIIDNLVSNAVKYSPKDTKIEIETQNKIDFIVIIVSDQGIGISNEDQKHIFDHFFRAENIGHTYGSGLGLSIVKRFVDTLKGEITVKSVVNEGSTFTVRLPK